MNRDMGCGGCMRRAIVILCVFVLMLGVFLPPAYAVDVGEDKGPEDPNATHPLYAYVQIDPLIFPITPRPAGGMLTVAFIISALGLSLSVLVQLEVEWDRKDEIAVYKPRLVDAYLQDLYGALDAGHGLMKNNFIDAAEIKQRLTDVTEKVLGPDHKVHAVLLQVLQQKPL